MKKWIVLFTLCVLVLIACSRQKPWIGTYMLVVNDENRDVFNTFQQMNTPWPHVELFEDGKFTLIQPQHSGSGVYRVEGDKLIMTLTEYNGVPPLGNLAQSKTIETRENFMYILFEGPNNPPWIKLPDETQ